MKFSTTGVVYLLAALATAENQDAGTQVTLAAPTPFPQRVKLSGNQNWDVPSGGRLERSQLKEFSAAEKDFLGEGWGKYVLCECKNYGPACTSTLSLAVPDAETGARIWYGHLYSGGPVTEKDFARNTKVSWSIVYNVGWSVLTSGEESEIDSDL
ncbi:hypothetical protein B0T16DRAFT_450552 [Cercophora newfieldiana]|uniref:Uncharacterized protein n=1 Tax=Cercophora newfieldiana TaxID=92897 RepID=A0AA39YMU5_9PEZI|nr:hypothetical protein B0T16DRAFT_450552 [Cercophora newfieldiana]